MKNDYITVSEFCALFNITKEEYWSKYKYPYELKGEYGKAPGEIDADLQKKVLGDDAPITCRFADTLDSMFDKTKEELGDLAKCDEDVLSYIAFPQQAEKFFEARKEKEKNTFKYSIRRVD